MLFRHDVDPDVRECQKRSSGKNYYFFTGQSIHPEKCRLLELPVWCWLSDYWNMGGGGVVTSKPEWFLERFWLGEKL